MTAQPFSVVFMKWLKNSLSFTENPLVYVLRYSQHALVVVAHVKFVSTKRMPSTFYDCANSAGLWEM